MRAQPYRPPCRDCAFRPGSKEMLAFVLFHSGPVAVKLNQISAHVRHGAAEVPFFCHQGMETSPDGGYLPKRDAAGVPIDENLCGGYRNVLEDERQGLDVGWLLQAVRATRRLVRTRVMELRAVGDRAHSELIDLLLDPGQGADRRRKACELREEILERARQTTGRSFDEEELAEVLTTGGPEFGLPSLVEASATWAADPALCEAPPTPEV